MLSELFLANGNHVFGVEPNAAMRAAAEELLGANSLFTSRSGTAEATTLADSSVDFVTAGQAFHWFDRIAARQEFARILKPDGWTALVWNERNAAKSAFDAQYEQLLEAYAVGYAFVNHRSIDADSLRTFFANEMQVRTFTNSQRFDFDGLKGRLLSSSYAPEPGDPNHDILMQHLRRLFDLHQTEGFVTIHYDTNVYFGRV